MGRPASTEKPPPLTPEQAALVVGWLAEWQVVRLVRVRWPGLYAACQAARMPDEDIEQTGMLGVVKAARTFDPTRRGADGRPVKFSTHANWRVRAEVGHSVPRYLGAPKGRPAIETVSGDLPGRASRRPEWEFVPDRAAGPAEDAAAADEVAERRERVMAALRTLPAYDRGVLAAHYGLIGFAPWKQAKIAAALGISRQRVEQVVTRAKEKLRPRLAAAGF